jgi:hypothetical protein
MSPRTRLVAAVLAGAPAGLPGVAAAQVIVLPAPAGAPAGRGFSGFGARPIPPTAVLHSRGDPTDSGATLGFAVAIRGTPGWYHAPTHFGELPPDSLAPGAVGQWWAVGGRRYRFVYDPARLTLALFDTTVDLRRSRVVLVTVSPEAAGRASVRAGRPVAITMERPAAFADVFLPGAPEVRAFAGLAAP